MKDITIGEINDIDPMVYRELLDRIQDCLRYDTSLEEPRRIINLKRSLAKTTDNREYRIIQKYIRAAQ